MTKIKLPEAYWYDLGDDVKFKIVDGTLPSFYKQDCAILDWEGVEDADGKSIPYSKEAVFELLNKYEEIRHWVSARVELPDRDWKGAK